MGNRLSIQRSQVLPLIRKSSMRHVRRQEARRRHGADHTRLVISVTLVRRTRAQCDRRSDRNNKPHRLLVRRCHRRGHHRGQVSGRSNANGAYHRMIRTRVRHNEEGERRTARHDRSSRISPLCLRALLTRRRRRNGRRRDRRVTMSRCQAKVRSVPVGFRHAREVNAVARNNRGAHHGTLGFVATYR